MTGRHAVGGICGFVYNVFMKPISGEARPEGAATFTPTDEQRAIIAHDRSHHARVLAGPGTGKSTTMVALLDRLLSEDEDLRVRMLTFTRAATAELAQKAALVCERAGQPSTVHSFAISVLLRNPGVGGLPEPIRIADSWELKTLVRPALARRAGLTVDKVKKLIQEMSANWESLTDEVRVEIPAVERTRFLGAWTEHRRVLGYTLLSELPHALHRALSDNNDLDGIDFDLLLVDEYQDLNACDLGVLRLLSDQGGCKILGTGDDDQSIYSWRMANPAGIRRFGNDYPGFDDYTLSVSLRCGKRIIEWANFVIQADPGRPATRACLDPLPESPDGEVALLRFPGNVAEAKGIARLAAALVADGVPERDILILTRTDFNGTFSAPIKEALAEEQVECSDPGYVVEMLSEPSNRELLEALRLLVNPDDSLAWRATLHLMPRVGETFCDYVYERAAASGQSFGAKLRDLLDEGFPDGPSSSARVATRMAALLGWIRQTPHPEMRPDTGWGTWLLNLTDHADALPQPSASLRELLVQLDSLTADEQSLSRFLALVEPLGKDLAQSVSNGVRIMTMGGSKGLTAEAVIIAGCEDGVMPRPGSDLSEERRILYVGMTRARRYLLCTWAGRRQGPTARAGGATLERRRFCDFFSGGPVASEDGNQYIQNRNLG